MSHAHKNQITIFMTNECNLKCKYCITDSNQSKNNIKEIDLEFAMKGIRDFFKKTNIYYLRFYGPGEPTCAFDRMKRINEYAKKISKGHLTVELQTNGFFSKEIAEWIKKNVDICWISLDGPSEINDKYRITSDWKPSSSVVMKNIDYLKNEIFVGIRITITDINIYRQKEIVKFFKSIGIKVLASKPVIPPVRNPIKSEGINIDIQKYAKEFFKAWKLAQKLDIFYTNILIANFDQPVNYACRACVPCPHLTIDGFVSACDRAFFGTVLDDLIYGKFDKISGEIVYFPEKISKIQSRVLKNLTNCSKCFMLENCAGGCLGTAYQLTGSIFGIDREYCEAIKFLGKKLPRNQGMFPYNHP